MCADLFAAVLDGIFLPKFPSISEKFFILTNDSQHKSYYDNRIANMKYSSQCALLVLQRHEPDRHTKKTHEFEPTALQFIDLGA